MTVSEFRNNYTQSSSSNYLSDHEFSVEVSDLQKTFKFIGIVALYKFVSLQLSGFTKLELARGSNLINVLRFYQILQKQLIIFVNDTREGEDVNNLNYRLRNLKASYIENNRNIFTYNSEETMFLVALEKENLSIANSTFQYLTKQPASNLNDQSSFTGYMIGYELRMRNWRKNKFPILKNNDYIKEYQKKFHESIGLTETELTNHLKDSGDRFETFWQELEQQRTMQEQEFKSWHTKINDDVNNFDKQAQQNINDLEETYSKKLMLSAPADHWNEEGQKHQHKGNIYLGFLICMILIAAIALWVILIEAPTNILASWFHEDRSVAIRWTIAFIAIMGLMAFGIKQMTKLMFSSYHLARDCQERKLLTNFYLSLLKEAAVDKDHQNLIISSLFSRAETGLLKEDGAPAMPGGDLLKHLFAK